MVNLGTNDASAFRMDAWVDEKTGRIYKQEKNPDGSCEQDSVDRFENAVYQFIALLRKNNPNACIIWMYGMLGREIENYIVETVDRYKKDNMDDKVSYLRLPDLESGWAGANNHPGAPSHHAAAQTIIEYLRGLLHD